MSNTQTVATFAGGLEGVAGAGNAATAPIAGVGTTLAVGVAPILGGGINLVNAQTAQTAYLLPLDWPLSAPLVVSNVGAAAALVFPGVASAQINGATAGTSYSVAVNKAVTFYRSGASIAGVAQWVAVGA